MRIRLFYCQLAVLCLFLYSGAALCAAPQDISANDGYCNTVNGTPHSVPEGETGCGVHDRLPTRGGSSSATAGIFVPDQNTPIEIDITSRGVKVDGVRTGAGITVMPTVVCMYFDNCATPTAEGAESLRASCRHTEGCAAGILHENPHIPGGTVYINNVPCPNCQGDPDATPPREANIPYILRPGQVLIVKYPDPDNPGGTATGHWIGGDPTFHDGEPPAAGGGNNNNNNNNNGAPPMGGSSAGQSPPD